IPHPCSSRKQVLTFERATARVVEISSAGTGTGERKSRACTCATVRLIPHRVPISPQCRMNFWGTGESVGFVVSVISVVSLFTEITVTTAVCQAFFSLPSARFPFTPLVKGRGAHPHTCPFSGLPCHLRALAFLSKYCQRGFRALELLQDWPRQIGGACCTGGHHDYLRSNAVRGSLSATAGPSRIKSGGRLCHRLRMSCRLPRRSIARFPRLPLHFFRQR